MRSWKLLFPLLASTLCFAVQPDRIAGPIDSSQMVTLPGHVHRNVKPQYDLGSADGSLQLSSVTLLTLPTSSQQKALAQLVSEQQDRKSPNFHKWLTPEQYASRFGLSQNDVAKISTWLESQGLSVVSVARGGNWIVFSGTASQVGSAFRTELHHYIVNGEMHIANATMPSIPAALSGIVVGIRGLDDFHPKPMNVKKAAPQVQSAHPNYYDNNYQTPDFVAPGDIAAIYDLTPLYAGGFDGTGQKLAVVGQTDVYLADLNDFRSGFGLTPISGCTTNGSGVITACNSSNFQYVLDGADPGVAAPSTSFLTEADLDIEWSGATARGAQIIYVNSTDAFTSYYYAIDNNLAPVISVSYGECEFDDNNLDADEGELKTAETMGITFMNSSGDSGVAECDGSETGAANNLAVLGLSVSYPASSPEVTGVGGTAVNFQTGFSGTYWGTTNGTDGGTATGYVPETSWNDDVEIAAAYGGTVLSIQESYAIVASGGGPSNCSVQTADFSSCVSGFPQPSWQTITIPRQASARFSPDVSLLASPNFPGYIYCTPVEELSTVSPYDTETTSSCASGIAAAVNGVPVGDPTTVSPSVVGGTSASSPVFAGIVAVLNQYLGGNGPVGFINPTLYTLAANTANGAFHQVTSGDNVVYCAGDTPAAPWPVALQCPGATGSIGSFGYQASNADTTTGYNLVTGLGSVDANNLAIAWAATLSGFTLAPSPGSVTAVAGNNSAPTTITITPQSGFTGTVTFSCVASTLPAGATCSFSSTSSTTSTLIIQTTADMAATTAPVAVTVTGTSGAVKETTTVNLTVTATTESFTLTPSATSLSINPGGTGTVTLTVVGANGFTVNNSGTTTTVLPLTYSCTGNPTESTCQFSPGSNSTPTSATSVVLSILTTPASGELRPPLGRTRRFLYAALLPGLFGLVLLGGSRKRAARGARLLGLILMLGFSTLWLGACGGSSSSGSGGGGGNSGTPAGTYTVVVNATTGGTSPVTSSVSIPLTVN